MKRIFVSGCFDLAHSGHLALLEFAKRQGDYLIVSIASDATIQELKRTPVVCEHDRWRLVSALRCVDEAFVSRGAGRQDCFSYVRALCPEVWVIDANDPIRAEKEALATEVGAEIVLNYRPEAGPSTTQTLSTLAGTTCLVCGKAGCFVHSQDPPPRGAHNCVGCGTLVTDQDFINRFGFPFCTEACWRKPYQQWWDDNVCGQIGGMLRREGVTR